MKCQHKPQTTEVKVITARACIMLRPGDALRGPELAPGIKDRLRYNFMLSAHTVAIARGADGYTARKIKRYPSSYDALPITVMKASKPDYNSIL